MTEIISFNLGLTSYCFIIGKEMVMVDDGVKKKPIPVEVIKNQL